VDKKNTVIGVLLIAAAIASMYLGNRNSMQRPTPEALRRAAPQQTQAAPAQEAFVPPGLQNEIVSANADHNGEKITTLENSFIQVRFTDYGGAIRDVALTHRLKGGLYQYPEKRDEPTPFVFTLIRRCPWSDSLASTGRRISSSCQSRTRRSSFGRRSPANSR